MILRIAEEFEKKITDGSKKTTIRRGKRDATPGESFRIENPATDYEYASRIRRVTYKKAGDLTRQDAIKDGFSSKDALLKKLQEFYPDLSDNEVVTIVEFK